MTNYTFYPKLLVRIPLRPLTTSFTLTELNELFKDPVIHEALYLSSPDLLSEYEKWLMAGMQAHSESKKLVLSLLKYILRLHSRCTPFGLFAGCSVVDRNQSMVVDPQKFSRSTRLDMDYTCALAANLAKQPYIKPYLKYYPNTSGYPIGDKLRYVEYFYKNKKRFYQISSVDNTEYLTALLGTAEAGATLNDLTKILTDNDVDSDDAQAFLQELIDAQLLVSELEPAVIGNETLWQMMTTLEEVFGQAPSTELAQLISSLQFIYNTLQSKDEAKAYTGLQSYRDVIATVDQLGVPFEAGKLFQTDLFQNIAGSQGKDGHNHLSESTHESLQKALTILNKLSPQSSRRNLETFKEQFIKKYEYSEVALLEVLDNENGIGYGRGAIEKGDLNPLIDDLPFAVGEGDASTVSWDRIDSFLFQKLLGAHKNDQYSVAITEDELRDIPANWADLPASMSVVFSHIGCEEGADVLFIRNAGNPSATNLLGRFAAGSTDVLKTIYDIADFEERYFKNEIVAEISHLPENRLGNVLLRPNFRKYEIPYLTRSSLPGDQQIPVNDLYVSIRNNQIRLRSKKLDKLVLPRLGTAHNFSTRSLPVYQFLCDMQLQGKRGGLFFDWRGIKNEFKFHPRVTVDRMIIFPATWQLTKKDLQSLLTYKKDNPDMPELLETVAEFRRQLKMPELVLLVEGDNELLIDFRASLSVELFMATIQKTEMLVLKEFLFDKDNAVVNGVNGGVYTNEIIATIFKNDAMEETVNSKTSISEPINSKRKFSLGSEWLYLKLYCGTKVADSLLTDIVTPVTDQLLAQGLINKWFFIRYYDPDFHLRIRFHLRSAERVGHVISLVNAEIAGAEQAGLIWKVQADAYERELERYGQYDISLTEEIFYADSRCSAKMLEFCPDDQARWLFALKSVDHFMDSFNLSLDTKFEYLEWYRNAYGNEFKIGKAFKLHLDKKFREQRSKISNAVYQNGGPAVLNTSLLHCLESRAQQLEAVAAMIRQQAGLHDKMLRDFISSHVHMILNRIFRSKPRENELVVYDFLLRTYQSEKARNNQRVTME
ncbi:lantibiotic dehydratase [Mucilaginibacter sp. BT774]|uniref:lantibiotic dehydratase n=1 Tax=Mucilaginibacter sp. BT774 TaxID=3062276 RepID=UPI00267573B4|nr:lantibiotic dehydratase [Mucilaginibacter sp. BT774]MDO3627170.1 lantibiotic dehydratase [Mucilaginibacter sp. BT774]